MEDDAFEDIGSAAARVVMGVARQEHRGPGTALLAGSRLSRFADAQAKVSLCAARHSGTAAGTDKGVALAAREDTASAALAGTGEARRAHNSGGGTAVVLEFKRRTGAAARGPYMPPRQCFRDRTPDERVGPSRITPATGGLGNARLREGR